MKHQKHLGLEGARLHHRRCGVREAAVCALGHVGGGLDVLPRRCGREDHPQVSEGD